MKLLKRVGVLTSVGMLASTCALAATEQVITRSLADWVSLVAEILSFVCLAVFILYAGRLLNGQKGGQSGDAQDATATRVNSGVKNGIMTALVGIALCQAVIIVAQAIFAK